MLFRSGKGCFMKEYTTEFLRNVALVSHGGAGKTMLAEAFLHATGRKVARSPAAGGKSELSRARGRVTPVRPGIHAGDPSVRMGRQTVPQKTNRRGSFAIRGKGEKAE